VNKNNDFSLSFFGMLVAFLRKKLISTALKKVDLKESFGGGFTSSHER
jgi:hypothetical protein